METTTPVGLASRLLELPTDVQMTITNIWITARNSDSQGFSREVEQLVDYIESDIRNQYEIDWDEY